jgi:subtilisin family serine protease
MSGDDSQNDDGIELSRRTFTKAAGAAAGAGLLGASAGTAAAADGRPLAEFTNPRVQELARVWEKGYRGRRDRAIGLTDSGIDARHPDLGPWNGVRAFDDSGDLKFVNENRREVTEIDVNIKDAISNPDAFPATESAAPGTFAEGSEVEVIQFSVTEPGETLMNAELDWEPNGDPAEDGNDLEFRLDISVGANEWEKVERAASANVPERLVGVTVEKGNTYRFVAESYANTVSEATVYLRSKNSPNSNPGSDADASDELGFYQIDVGDEGTISQDPHEVGSDAKTIGWVNETSRYGSTKKPRDPDGHGSHVASIMGGTGEASAISREVAHGPKNSPRRVVVGDSVFETVTVKSGEAGVYASAYGKNIEIEIVGPGFGDVAASSTVGVDDTSEYDNNTVSTPAKPGEDYIVEIRAASEGATDAIAQGINTAGEVEAFSVGTFADPGDTSGDGVSADGDSDLALHSGVAPNASLVGFQGLSDPTNTLAEFASEFSSRFNLRTVNMSWGYVGGLPLGAFGQGLDLGVVSNIKTMAKAGILTVAAAGNSATPANGNGAPAVADEAISVVSTGPNDGVVSYSSGGLGGNDEDGEGQYMKPDVTAPGGAATDLIKAAEADTNPDNFDKDTEPRDNTGIAGTSMASPFTNGVAGLVGDAMEEEGLINAPASADIEDVYRLKQVVLATASETAFTAAPYHRGKAPSYQQGGRDPYEGFGRVNPDAAIDGVTRDLVGRDLSATTPSATPEKDRTGFGISEFGEVGLDVPRDSRAVAGYVEVARGEIDLVVSADDLTGEDAGMAVGGPQIDVFVYDVTSPDDNGEPNIVSSGRINDGGSINVGFDAAGGTFDLGEDDTRRVMVVAKLVNVPGLVNGFDARVSLDFAGRFTPAELPAFGVAGTRQDKSDRFTANTRNRVKVTVTEMDIQDGEIRDRVPSDWDVREDFGDFEEYVEKGDTHDIISLGDVDESNLSQSRVYFVTTPNSNASYTFGPARVFTKDTSNKDGIQTASGEYRNQTATFGGTDSNLVVGGTNVGSSDGSTTSTTDSTTGTTDSTTSTSTDGGSTTDTVTDTVEDTL